VENDGEGSVINAPCEVVVEMCSRGVVVCSPTVDKIYLLGLPGRLEYEEMGEEGGVEPVDLCVGRLVSCKLSGITGEIGVSLSVSSK